MLELFENNPEAYDNTTQIFKSKAQKKRYDKSKRYTRDAAIEMAVARVQGKMPGPITSAIAGFVVKMKYRIFWIRIEEQGPIKVL